MRALQYTRVGGAPELREVDEPTPGLGEVLLRITASGLCHSDQVVMSYSEEQYPYPLPMTFGHEPAGVVAELGEGATGVAGAVVIVGAGGGSAKVGLLTAPFDVEVSTSLWGRRRELLELVEMAHRGQIGIETTTYPLDDAVRAHQDLHEGKIRGRAVVVP
jgi:D-arabinose 1-dehydrogenase-like Zn-dependent alcohol dehydrogenase